ncbi:MAG TPA: hypothetical protein VHD62_10970 [Opitutaceae bacterium]|nr:hypothetical protein [Opitutaceae bacterium]
MRRFLAPLLFGFACILCHGADAPVPVQQEPMHRPVFENDYVRIIDVQIPPGKNTLYHIHVIPSVVVYLTKATNRSQTWGETTFLNRHVSPGESRYAPYDEKSLTHQVTNTGATLFRVFDIELLRPAPAVAPSPTSLSAPAVRQWTEKRVAAARVPLAANQRCAFAPDACAHLLIGISGAVNASADARHPEIHRTLKNADYVFLPPQTAFELRSEGAAAEALVLELH